MSDTMSIMDSWQKDNNQRNKMVYYVYSLLVHKLTILVSYYDFNIYFVKASDDREKTRFSYSIYMMLPSL